MTSGPDRVPLPAEVLSQLPDALREASSAKVQVIRDRRALMQFKAREVLPLIAAAYPFSGYVTWLEPEPGGASAVVQRDGDDLHPQARRLLCALSASLLNESIAEIRARGDGGVQFLQSGKLCMSIHGVGRGPGRLRLPDQVPVGDGAARNRLLVLWREHLAAERERRRLDDRRRTLDVRRRELTERHGAQVLRAVLERYPGVAGVTLIESSGRPEGRYPQLHGVDGVPCREVDGLHMNQILAICDCAGLIAFLLARGESVTRADLGLI